MRLLHIVSFVALLTASNGEDLKPKSRSYPKAWPYPNSGPWQWQVGQPVRTTSGTVIGHPASKRPEVSEYLGIPFAQPPVGYLRFGAPQTYYSDQTFYASAFSPDCPANLPTSASLAPIADEIAQPQGIEIFEELGQVGNNQSEDCLTLNIWTKPQVGARKKAVMFWIYGGGFQTGTTDMKAINGQYFAEDDDVVLVTANYRLNIFGFPGLPDIPGATQNPGLMDQRLAVEWVRANIEGFGGDPNRITLMGQSAGAASVDIYQFAYTYDPIAHAFIQESGTARSFADPWPSDHISDWYNMSVQVGCGGSEVSLQQSLYCVRTKPFQAILNATRIANPLQAVLGIFGPTVDEKIVFSDYALRGAVGNFIKGPLLLGNTFYEAGLFKLLAQAGGENIPDSEWALFNQAIFQCPTSEAAQVRVSNWVPTYRYLYFGAFYNLALSLIPPSGAYHTSEIPVVFETIEDVVTIPSTPAESKISRYMNAAWSTFAKDPYRGLSDSPRFRFPRYNPQTPSLILLAVPDQAYPFIAPPISYDSICPALEAIAALIPGGLPALVTTGEQSESDADDSLSRYRKNAKKTRPLRATADIQVSTKRLTNHPLFNDEARRLIGLYLAKLRGEVSILDGASPLPSTAELPDGPLLDSYGTG